MEMGEVGREFHRAHGTYARCVSVVTSVLVEDTQDYM